MNDNRQAGADSSRESGLPYSPWYPLVAGAIVGVILRLVISGEPEGIYTEIAPAFVFLVPLAVGAVTVYLAEGRKRCDWAYYAAAGAIANVLFILGTLAILLERLLCKAGSICSAAPQDKNGRRPRSTSAEKCAATLPLTHGFDRALAVNS